MTKNKNLTIALIYDFDGTLSPKNMQEFGFISAVGKTANDFWTKSNKMAVDHDADQILCYMKTMIDEAKNAGVELKRESFLRFGRDVELFNGVKEWFSLINNYGHMQGVEVKHYINSSGLAEMIEGTSIAKEFERIYACSFLYDENGVAVWPAVAIDYTTKTQFLFKINKGIESVSDNVEVNKYTPETERPIPFKHMIYFGDGETDVPCMRLIKQLGGYSIAVFNPEDTAKRLTAQHLIADGRVNFVCPADYTENHEIYKIVTSAIDKIKSDYDFDNLLKAYGSK